MNRIFLWFTVLVALAACAMATKVTIDLNRRASVDTHIGTSAKSKPTISMTNSETGVKVVAKGNRLTSSIHSDNTQHIEHTPLERKYYKKGEVVLDQIHQ
jgi:hypothetical protein